MHTDFDDVAAACAPQDQEDRGRDATRHGERDGNLRGVEASPGPDEHEPAEGYAEHDHCRKQIPCEASGRARVDQRRENTARHARENASRQQREAHGRMQGHSAERREAVPVHAVGVAEQAACGDSEREPAERLPRRGARGNLGAAEEDEGSSHQREAEGAVGSHPPGRGKRSARRIGEEHLVDPDVYPDEVLGERQKRDQDHDRGKQPGHAPCAATASFVLDQGEGEAGKDEGDRRVRLHPDEPGKDILEHVDAEGPGEEYRDPKSD